MCGIFGFVSTDTMERQKMLAAKLFRLSESRGMEASGFAGITRSEIVIYKTPLKGTGIIRTPAFQSYFSSMRDESVFIGHSRLATNGSAYDNHNNQPVIKHGIICVHNGIIVNEKQVWSHHKNHFKKTLDVDTELLPTLFHFYRRKKNDLVGAIQKTYGEIQGAATFCLAPMDKPYFILATNTGSLYVSSDSNNSLVFASEEYILRQVFPIAPTRIKSDSGLLVQYDIKKMFPFRLTKKFNTKLSKITYRKRTITDVSDYHKNFSVGKPVNSYASLARHQPDYGRIHAIRRCTRCILPETMPLISFNTSGVCNFCMSYKKQNPKGESVLREFIKPFRSDNGNPDCIVALSGGRDSSYGLHYAKNVLNLHPIAFTYDWGMITDIARRNQSRMTAALGVEHVVVSADIRKKRENIRKNLHAWLRKPNLGMVTLLMAGDKQAEYYAEDLKRKTGIRLIIYCRGNTLEDERFKFGYFGIFDGTPNGVIHNLSASGKMKMLWYYGKQFVLNPGYLNRSLLDTAFAFSSSYVIPHKNFVYLWHYIPWNEKHITSTLIDTYGWETPKDTIATWRIDDGTPPFYNYVYYHTQGFTEHDCLRSNQIREGIITRNHAISLVNEENKPRYEALQWYFNMLEMRGDDVLTRVDAIPTLY